MATPTQFLREAIRAVPAVKYALGVGGIVSVIAIVYSFKIDLRIALLGTVVMLILMGVLVVFARMSSLAKPELAAPALVFTWFVLLFFMAVSVSLFSSVFFQKPLDLAYWLTPGHTTPPAPPPVNPSTQNGPVKTAPLPESVRMRINGIYPGEIPYAEVQLTAYINNREYRYPSLAGVEWMRIGPQMAPMTFDVTQASSYSLRFEGKLRWHWQGQPPFGGTDVVVLPLASQSVENAETLPFKVLYRLFLVDPQTQSHGTRLGAVVDAEILSIPQIGGPTGAEQDAHHDAVK